MRTTNKLNTIFIKNAEAGEFSDGAGLYLIKSSKISGKWVYKYSFAKKRKKMGLGAWPNASIAEVRKLRDKWAEKLLQGLDPIHERKRLINAEKEAQFKIDPTFEEIANEVYEAKKTELRGDGVNGRWFSPIRLHVIPKLGKRPISQIHQTEIADALRPIWRKKFPTAEKAIQRMHIIFEQARFRGVDCDPYTVKAAQHMLGVVIHQTKPIAATPWQEIPALYDKLDETLNSHLALKWLILNLVRSKGSRGAMFDEFKGNVWTVPAERVKGKRGLVKSFRVPLSTEATRILGVCKARRSTPYLFTGRKSKALTEAALRKSLNDIKEPGRIHGFRTSFRTWVQDNNTADYDVAETILDHKLGGTVERSYARSDLLERRLPVMELWGKFVTGQSSASIILLAK